MPNIEQLTGNPYVLIGAGAVVLLFLLVVFRALFGGKAGPAQEKGLQGEDLADYPPPPAAPGPRRLTVEGIAARIRLVVVAPIGREQTIDSAAVEGLLDQVMKGLAAACRQDKPRVRVWPAQLSNKGFGPTFHRLVEKPEEEGQPSRWVLVAGVTPPRPRPILLGLALLADDANTIGRLTLEADQWADTIRFQG